MKKALVAAACLLPWPGMATAAELHPYYNKGCAPVRAALQANLGTKDGALLWNDMPVDWGLFQSYLGDLPNTPKRDGPLYITVDEKIPHREEIVAILAKEGFTLHHCPLLRPNVFDVVIPPADFDPSSHPRR